MIFTVGDLIAIISAAIAIGTVLWKGGGLNQQIVHLQKSVNKLEESIDSLHHRVTDVKQRVSKLEGRLKLNGK